MRQLQPAAWSKRTFSRTATFANARPFPGESGAVSARGAEFLLWDLHEIRDISNERLTRVGQEETGEAHAGNGRKKGRLPVTESELEVQRLRTEKKKEKRDEEANHAIGVSGPCGVLWSLGSGFADEEHYSSENRYESGKGCTSGQRFGRHQQCD